MRRFGWLMLLPLVGAWVLTAIVVQLSDEKGGLWRLLGVFVSLAIGGVCVRVGYWVGFEGFTEGIGAYRQVTTYPVYGWILMIGGGLIALMGIVSTLVGMKMKE